MPSDGRNAPPSPPALYWLAQVQDWSGRLRDLAGTDARAWSELVALANAPLDWLDTLRLDRRLTRLFGDASTITEGVPRVRLAVLASSTVDHLLPALRVAALRHGIRLQIHTTPYGQYVQELLDRNSALHRFCPETVLFALDTPHVLAGFAEAKAQGQTLGQAMVRHWNLARDSFNCGVVQQTLMPVSPNLLGSNEHRLPDAPAWLAQRFNLDLRELADAERVDLLAIDARVARDGLRTWHDPALWHRAKQEIHPAAAPVYGDLFGRLLAARLGRSRKCLVLDLDNTLWGGVIGDDGLDGIVLGQGSALGEAYVAFQDYALALSRRGVILAVCSKNDLANALEPFELHPEMVLRRSDIACFVANWNDKAANVRAIGAQLNIGLDSLVFVDDNPAERAIVRRELPMVAVPELPEDPSLYRYCLADAGYFEATGVTGEDLQRTRQYQANAERASLNESATDLAGYLRSLEMELRWGRFDRVALPRVVQLINKTNQFNLTTRRYSEAAAIAVMEDDRALSLHLRLLDRFGDNGIIAIVIGKFAEGGADMVIDTWLMSCRVLGRQVEEATLNLVAAEASRLGAARVIGEYRPTAKNGMVRDHYARLGFAPLAEAEDGSTRWGLALEAFAPAPTCMTITAI